MPFDLHARNFFLTYPHCPLHPQYALAFFQTLYPEATYIGVGQETHEDGDYHLHALVMLPKKTRIRDESYFDLFFGDEQYHGNYQAAKSPKDAACYIKKEGGAYAKVGITPVKKGSAYRVAIDSAQSATEFRSKLLELAPRDAVLYSNAISSFAEIHFGGGGSGFQPVRNLSTFVVPDALQQWVDNEVCTGGFTPRPPGGAPPPSTPHLGGAPSTPPEDVAQDH